VTGCGTKQVNVNEFAFINTYVCVSCGLAVMSCQWRNGITAPFWHIWGNFDSRLCRIKGNITSKLKLLVIGL